jgi:hypothetical protein
MKLQISKKQYSDLEQFYDLVKSDAGIVEGFFLTPDNKSASVYFDDKTDFAQTVLAFNAKGFTCYAGLQPRKKNSWIQPRINGR